MSKKLFSKLLTVVLLVLFIGYFVKNYQSFSPLLDIPLYVIVIILLIKLVRQLSNGLFIQWTVEVFTKRFSLKESIYLSTLSAVGNFLGPLLGGTTIRAVYLKKIHKLSYSFFTSTLAGYYVILFGFGSLLGLISLLFIENNPQRNGLLVFFAVWFVVMVGLIFIKLPNQNRFTNLQKNKVGNFIVTVLYSIEKGWGQIKSTKNLILKLSLLSLSGYILLFIITWIEFSAIGVDVSPAGLGLYSAISSSAILLSFTPGAIGIKEGLLILNASVMGVTNDQILQVAVIDRALMFLLLGGMYVFTHKMKNSDTADSQ